MRAWTPEVGDEIARLLHEDGTGNRHGKVFRDFEAGLSYEQMAEGQGTTATNAKNFHRAVEDALNDELPTHPTAADKRRRLYSHLLTRNPSAELTSYIESCLAELADTVSRAGKSTNRPTIQRTPGLAGLTAAAVTAAIDEYDKIGEKAFLDKYGFGRAKDYFVIHNGRSYDSKAIAGAAHGYLPGQQPLRSDEFSGREATVARRLRLLGFRVPPKRSPPWVRDEMILACDLVDQNNWQCMDAEDPRVIKLSGLLQELPFHPPEVRSDTFRNPNCVARKTVDIATHHPAYEGAKTNGGVIDEEVLQEFLDDPAGMHAIAEALRRAILEDNEDLLAPVDDEDDKAKEGRLLQRQHFVRERDKKLRAKKIADFLKHHHRVHCEVCRFDFEATYGERGLEYTEVHHVVPLHASGETTTNIADLILLCANCHRMIHRYTPWLTPDELRGLLPTRP